jgi:hypothetical protein
MAAVRPGGVLLYGRTSTLDPHLNLQVLVASACAIGLSLIVFGLWPAFRLSRTDMRSAMATSSEIVSPSWRTERVLIRVQSAVSVALFCGAAGFIGVVFAQHRMDPGFDLDNLTVARAVFRLQAWDEARGQNAVEAITAVAPARFGYRAVALSSSLPVGADQYVYAVTATDPADISASKPSLLMASTPHILDALGIPLVAGRAFNSRDIAGTDPVVIISEASALMLFGTRNAVGLDLHMRGSLNALDQTTIEKRNVIGVTRDTDVGSLMKRGEPLVFVPLAQRYEPPSFIVARGDSGSGDLRALIRAGDPDVAVDNVGSGLVMTGGAWFLARIVAGLALILGALTLALTMAGLFGVLSSVVVRRSQEIGIRRAMGADDCAIKRMVLRDGARPVASGTLIGLFLGILGGFLIRASIPSEAPPIPLIAMLIVAVTVVPATMAACYFPARRAMRVDPNITLKDG